MTWRTAQHRDALHHAQVMIYWADDSEADAAQAWLSLLFAAMQRVASGSYRNYPNRFLPRANERYFGANLKQLQQLKRQFDPRNVFNYSQGLL